jgi:chaperone required for assembly of F1-ATPase
LRSTQVADVNALPIRYDESRGKGRLFKLPSGRTYCKQSKRAIELIVKLTRTFAERNEDHSADKANIVKLPKAAALIFSNKRKEELIDKQHKKWENIIIIHHNSPLLLHVRLLKIKLQI